MEDFTVKELRSLCKKKGLKKYSYLNKKDLIDLLNQNGGERLQKPKRVYRNIKKDLKKSYVSVYKIIKTPMTVMKFLKKNKIKDKAEIVLILSDKVYKFTLKDFLQLKERNNKDFLITMINLNKKNQFIIYAK
jgi:hypothetical protein